MIPHRFITVLITAALTVGTSACSSSGGDDDCSGAKCDNLGQNEYHYIVVGSGAGGGPLAARLARAGYKTLLLEAGDDTGADDDVSQIPLMHAAATEQPGLAWSYYVKHYDQLERRQRDSKFMCQNESGDQARCSMQPSGQCECPASHPEELGILYPRGGMLGGSNGVNAMIHVLPQDSDWRRIADLTGDSSWAPQEMDKYYAKVREWLVLSTIDPKLVLESLDLKLGVILVTTVIEFVKRAWKDGPEFDVLNIAANFKQMENLLVKDLNQSMLDGNDAAGMWAFPVGIDKGRRRNTRERVRSTVEEGHPLTIMTNTLVTKVNTEPGKDGKPVARGVAFRTGSHLYKADLMYSADTQYQTCESLPQGCPTATNDVILSAGAFNSPQLLMLSGIGPKDELKKHGIEVVKELPGVGENLQDRYEVGVVYQTENSFSVIKDCTLALDESDKCYRDWACGGDDSPTWCTEKERKDEKSGVYGANGAITSMLLRSDGVGTRALAKKEDTDLHVFGVPGMFKGYYPGYSKEGLNVPGQFTWVILKAHTQNQGGRVTLRSSDPTDWPEINFRYFEDGEQEPGQAEDDVTAVVNAIRFVQGIATLTNKVMILSGFEQVIPDPETVDTDEKIADWVKNEAWGHHASCSNKIGADGDKMAVLDSEFRVRGVDRLRVVDASVFPRIPGTFILLPTLMISEKAADVILQDAAADAPASAE